MQLSQELLAEFGGMRAVVAHFKAAPTSEACRNLLVVMLDHVIYHLTQVTHSLWSVLGDTFKMANILEASFTLCTVQSFHTDASQLITSGACHSSFTCVYCLSWSVWCLFSSACRTYATLVSRLCQHPTQTLPKLAGWATVTSSNS